MYIYKINKYMTIFFYYFYYDINHCLYIIGTLMKLFLLSCYEYYYVENLLLYEPIVIICPLLLSISI